MNIYAKYCPNVSADWYNAQERAKEIEAYNKGIKDALMEAAKIPTTNIQNCITYWQIEILQLEDKLKIN